MSNDAPFAKLVPGFDFLQNLVKNAGQAMPGIGQWVAPTLDPEELDKRIGELRTVQFWLEQNARLIGGTIQALEVQRMTLSTLQNMNVQMGDLRDALTARVPTPGAAATPSPAAAPAPAAGSARTAQAAAEPAKAAESADNSAPPAVDPMQWWGALTTQFTEIAANALRDSTSEKAQALADEVVKQSIDAASNALKAAAEPLQSVVRGAAAGVAGAAAAAPGKKAAPPAPAAAAPKAAKPGAKTAAARPTAAAKNALAAKKAPARKAAARPR